ncbi:MAG: NAD-dependent succinate-semialdehyde dehydrogenase [Planctomycetes bacterium]|nr:NAD-dependent succinate-semialdehyde dehydrogenase [Planctomycetota bacterium]
MAGRALESVDPTSGQRVRVWPELDGAGLERRVSTAHAEAARWARTSLAERAERLRGAARLFGERAEALALVMAEEMGKPLAQGRAEAQKCALACEFYAEHAPLMLADEAARPARPGAREFVSFRPLGVVLAIMPWNFPLWQVVRCAAPTLMAGNGLLLKHAENVQGCAEALEALFQDAGLPRGLCANCALAVARVPALIHDRRIAAVTLTGSTRAGRAVAACAGAALKKCVLELGGSDPYLVLADADLELAARTCAVARLINAGQSCIAAKRFIVLEPVRAEFTERLVAEMRAKTVGDPRTAVDLGPLARADLRDSLHAQVEKSVERGARLLLGGERPRGPGSFYPPSVLADVVAGQPAYEEELFGPVAAILAARDEAHALVLANDTRYGLGAAVFTRDVERGLRLAKEELQAGCVFVNDFVRSDPRLPFGGIKDSGFGREFASFGLREFVNVKTVVVG